MVEVVEKIEVREAPAELDELGKVLLKARDTIREWGWCQNAYSKENGDLFPSVCAIGAVNCASGFAVDADGGNDYGARGFHQIVAQRMGFRQVADLANWNDTTDRTQQEVEERLERAAYKL